MKSLSILGSTGSIGKGTLDIVARYPERYRIAGLSAQKNTDRLMSQVERFQPRVVSLIEEAAAMKLRNQCRHLSVEVLWGPEGQREVATLPEVDLVVSAIVGSAGLDPTLAAIRAGKNIALANKETLVMAGQVVCQEAKERGVSIIPVDSEHNAVFQVLDGRTDTPLRRIILTASGGPLIDLSPEELMKITPAQALRHPTWQMGAKITIDSATLMNKGLEVIEAHHLFNLKPDEIDVLVHRQSIVHSMVEFVDGSIMAQLGNPDMRAPLSFALNYPERLPLDLPRMDFEKVSPLTFEQPNRELFPCLSYAYETLSEGGTLPAVLNAANEEAVWAFLREEILFTDIAKIIRGTLDSHQSVSHPTLGDIQLADRWARENAGSKARAMAQA